MGIPNGYKPRSGAASDTWEDWMDVVELTWRETMDAARVEYEGIRDALQTQHLDENRSPPERISAHLRAENSAK